MHQITYQCLFPLPCSPEDRSLRWSQWELCHVLMPELHCGFLCCKWHYKITHQPRMAWVWVAKSWFASFSVWMTSVPQTLKLQVQKSDNMSLTFLICTKTLPPVWAAFLTGTPGGFPQGKELPGSNTKQLSLKKLDGVECWKSEHRGGALPRQSVSLCCTAARGWGGCMQGINGSDFCWKWLTALICRSTSGLLPKRLPGPLLPVFHWFYQDYECNCWRNF